MTKHTPGPWEIVADEVGQQNNIRGYYIGHRESTAYVAEVSRLWGISDDGEVEANADIIAAAPEMLEALYGIETLYSELQAALPETVGTPAYDRIQEAVRRARVAIAKATGCPWTALEKCTMNATQCAERAATLIKTRTNLGDDFDICFSDNRKQVEALLIEMAGNDPTLLASMWWHNMLHLVAAVYSRH